jgi:PKD repeat protein
MRNNGKINLTALAPLALFLFFFIIISSTASADSAQSLVASPKANFSYNITSGFAPLSVQFNDSSQNATEWNWDFGDGSNSTDQNPTHTYAEAGNYTVNLTTINANGTNSTVTTITVSGWEYSPKNLVSGDIINIKGNASPGEKIDAFANFNKTIPVSGGKFEYILENVKIPDGLKNSFTVKAIGAKNLNVRVKMLIWLTKSSEALGNTAIVSQSNVPPGTYDIKIDGDAGEGISSVNLNITASQEITADSKGNFSCSYDTTSIPPGIFEIEIGSITKELIIQPKENLDMWQPVAIFSSNVTSGFAPLTVRFVDQSENTTGLNWDFGDGTNSTEQNPIHIYSAAGNYTVSLTATNVNGTNTTTSTITVLPEEIKNSSGTIEWGPSMHYDTGSSSSLTMDNAGHCIETHIENEKLFYRVGDVNFENYTINWGPSIEFDTGNSTTVSMDNSGNCIESHSSKGSLFYRVGKVNFVNDTINWRQNI